MINLKIYLHIPEKNFLDDFFIHWQSIFKESFRPWKLFTFILGMAWLIYGAIFWDYPDWDIGVSIIMGSLAYFLAPWSIRTFWRALKYKPSFWWLQILFSILAWIFTVDTSYYLWHSFMHNQMFRFGNFFASTYLYFLCGFLWLYKGSLKNLYYHLKLTTINK